MKLLHKDLDKDGKGSIALVPEQAEDMWHAYNLISVGDFVRASTIRKVQQQSDTGSSTSSRVRVTLTIAVGSVDFDIQGCTLRLKGQNVQENQYVKLGAHHTLDLELNRKFNLIKEVWDSVALERVELACDPSKSADLAAIVMQEGMANICLVTPSMTVPRAKVEHQIPRKRKGFASQHDKGLQRFFESVFQALLRHINFEVVKCVIIASPGFVKDQFYSYMLQQANQTDNKLLLDNKQKFVLAHASSGFKHSLKEILADPSLGNRLSDTKAAAEVKALATFHANFNAVTGKACYGYRQIERANEAQAVETLLISDKLFRANDVGERKKYVALVDSVREYGGEVRIFSSLHVSGADLENITGIAAILRFPMPELEDIPTDSDSESEND